MITEDDAYPLDMCGRFAQVFQLEELEQIERVLNQATGIDQSLIELWSNDYSPAKPSYNIAPTQYATIIHAPSLSRIGLTQAHFGLIPPWAKDRSRSGSMINARSETIASKPAYRDPFRSGRCLLPINGFFEWQKTLNKNNKQPWYIHRGDGAPMFLAGIMSTWLDPEHGHCEVDSFSVITTEPNAAISEIHNRMPVVVEPESISTWFDPSAESRELKELLAPASEGVLAAHRVHQLVNSPSNNTPLIIKPDANAQAFSLWG